MRRAIITLLVLLSFGLKAQVYQAMPQAGYGPVKRMLFDSVLTIPLNINQLRNITGGRDAGQIRYNVTDSGLYVYSGYQWIKANLDSTNISNRINGKLNISDTAAMLLPYMKFIDTVSLSNRINLRVKYSDTAQMLSVYLRKLDTASLSRRIDKKQDSITLTTNFKSGAATLIGATLNIPKYSDTLSDAYVPYVGANKNVELGNYNLTGSLLNADYSLQIKNEVGAGGASTPGYTSISSNNTGYYFYTNYSGGQKGAYFNYPTSGTTFSYNLPVRAGTLALVEDTVNLSNRINLKADKATVLTINGVGYDLSANRTWTIPVFDSTSISNRLNLKLNISDTALMLSPYLRKADTSSLSNRIDLKLNISDTAAMLSPYLKSAVTSVGLSMPNAFSVANSPITSTGTIAVTGAGTAAQYIRGDGQLATLPSGVSGGSSVNYYLNGSVNQGTIGGSVYYEMNKTSVLGAGTDFALAGNGLISQFITDVADPNRLQIPAGNWNFEIYMSASSSGGTPKFYVELLKYDGTNFTSIASSSANPEAITGGTTIDLYLTALAIPQTTLLATDRLAIRVYIVNSTGGRTITMHTENSHLCEIITNFAGGVSALNGLTANTQYLAVGTSGNDFAINSLTDTHTFNLPTASSTKRGALSSTDWSTFNDKMNYSDTVSLSNRINLKLNSSDTISLSNRINTKLNATDTASLSNRINAKADALSGTTNTVPKFTSGTTIGNSNIKDDGSAVSVSTTAGSNGALQVGSYNGNILMNTNNTTGGLIFQNTSSSNKLWDISSFNNDLNINESNVALAPPRVIFKAGGDVLISSLIGSGTRMVVASSTGVLSTQSITGVDTTSLSNRINLKLNISDTASMLSGYQSAINSKQAAITLTTNNTSGAATFSSNTLNIPQYQAAGTYVTSVTGTSPIVSSGGTTPAISIPAATSSVNGYLSSTDWSTFNGKESALTFSSPLVRTTNTISIPVATTSVNGYLSATDWTTFNNKYNLPSLTNGSVLFSNGTTIAQDNSNFFWDDTNNRLGIGTASPTGRLMLYQSSAGNVLQNIVSNQGGSTQVGINLSPSMTDAEVASNPAQASIYATDSNYGANIIFATKATGAVGNALTTRLTIASTGTATFETAQAINTTFNSTNASGGYINFKRSGTNIGYLGNSAQLGIGTLNALELRADNDLFLTTTSGTLAIKSGGNVLIGSSTDAGYKLYIEGNANLLTMSRPAAAKTYGFQIASSGDFILRDYTASSDRMTIASGGAVTISNLGTGTVTASSGTLSTVSDSSYKIADGFIEDALPNVMNLKPRYFYWKDKSGLDTTIRQLGFYAQEVNSAIGEEAANTPKENSPWGITDRSLIAFLTKAIQELSVKNEALIKRIETLENK